MMPPIDVIDFYDAALFVLVATHMLAFGPHRTWRLLGRAARWLRR